MNDLAQLALGGLAAVRRAVAARPLPLLAVTGIVASAAVVVTGGRLGAAPTAVPLDRWLGVLPSAGYRITGVAIGTGLLAAVAVLLGSWLLTVRLAARFSARELWALAGGWALPFVIGPPVMSTDVFGYIARGLLATHGRSPYVYEPSALGTPRIVEAIDPTWRGAESSDGPLTLLLAHLVVAASGGAVVPALLVFRLIAILSVVAIGRFASELAGPSSRGALALTILNPAVLLYVVSAGHLVGAVLALLLGAVVAARRRRWAAAVALVAVAAAIKPVALIALPFVIGCHLLGVGPRRALRMLVGDVAIAVVVFGALTMAVGPPFGWLRNFGDAFHENLPFTPASLLGNGLGWLVPAAYDDLQTGARLACAAGAAVVICFLLAGVRARPMERSIGLALLAAAVCAPVLYPQFLLWGIVCLAPTATGLRRDLVMALSCAACVLTPLGFGERGGRVAAGIALAVIAAGLAAGRLLVAGKPRSYRDPRAARRDRGDVPRAWPFLAPHRGEVDALRNDLQHSLRLDHRERGA
jgi:hypothetical protein